MVKKVRVVLTLEEKIKITDMLRAHTARDMHGVVRYVDGWNDERIANAISGRVDYVGVRRVRNSLFGPSRLTGEKRREIKAREKALKKGATESQKQEIRSAALDLLRTMNARLTHIEKEISTLMKRMKS
jgi:hypothetical protein